MIEHALGAAPAATVQTVDDTLVARARRGDAAAFTEIFERYHHRIVNYIYGLVHDRELANDLAQDSFLKAYKALPRMGDDLRLAPWLYRIAGNTAFSALRRRKLIRWLPLLNDGIEASSADNAVVEAEAVQRALAKLPAKYAAPLLLHSHEGLSCNEIAAILGISPGAVKTRLFRAREAFRAAYGEGGS
ncbi:MAG TPA: RNA polymerase sigma factor [Thermomicrobiales bacterium]|nr:RNA polymerase sigma factor [Thermomicrobiales bacterium]